MPHDAYERSARHKRSVRRNVRAALSKKWRRGQNRKYEEIEAARRKKERETPEETENPKPE